HINDTGNILTNLSKEYNITSLTLSSLLLTPINLTITSSVPPRVKTEVKVTIVKAKKNSPELSGLKTYVTTNVNAKTEKLDNILIAAVVKNLVILT
ncbi:hypothetical protein AB4490_24225, partial [Vibrio cyclitrophicus]